MHLPFREVVPGPQFQIVPAPFGSRPAQSPSFRPKDLAQSTHRPMEELFLIRGGIQSMQEVKIVIHEYLCGVSFRAP